jgi:hypothetical protein
VSLAAIGAGACAIWAVGFVLSFAAYEACNEITGPYMLVLGFISALLWPFFYFYGLWYEIWSEAD